MIERLRLVPLPAAVAALGLAALAWLGLYGFAWNDYDDEARLAVDVLVRGDLKAFAALIPAYGGSLLMRAPFALAASRLGGGDLAVYRTLAVPCLAAVGGPRSRRRGAYALAGRAAIAWGTAIGLIAANPIELRALDGARAPEELLVSALCAGAALAGSRGGRRWPPCSPASPSRASRGRCSRSPRWLRSRTAGACARWSSPGRWQRS